MLFCVCGHVCLCRYYHLYLLHDLSTSSSITCLGQFQSTFQVGYSSFTEPLCGWCMLGVFLLPAFTRLRHECPDLLSPCKGMHVCTY